MTLQRDPSTLTEGKSFLCLSHDDDDDDDDDMMIMMMVIMIMMMILMMMTMTKLYGKKSSHAILGRK